MISSPNIYPAKSEAGKRPKTTVFGRIWGPVARMYLPRGPIVPISGK